MYGDVDGCGFGIFADIGQRFLYQAVDGQLCGFAQFHGLQMGFQRQTAARGKLAGQNFQCSGQPQIRQGRGAQVFHDPALECNTAVERFRQVLDAVGRFRVVHVDLGLQACHIELGSSQQCTQFVM